MHVNFQNYYTYVKGLISAIVEIIFNKICLMLTIEFYGVVCREEWGKVGKFIRKWQLSGV